MWMLGIDTGGTFTDVAALDTATGRMHVAKVPSTPANPAQGALDGIRALAEQVPGMKIPDIEFFAHGTTVATNALLERKGSRTGLIINRGFRAIYDLRGGLRPTGGDLIDPFYRKPAGLVDQASTEEVDGRLAHDGTEIVPLDEESVRRAARALRDKGIGSVAVCFLFSFMNDAHERRAEAIIREEYPECRVSLSSRIHPVIREFQRLSTTVADAYVGPVIEGYLMKLWDGLRELGILGQQLYIMQSNGGLMRIDVAARYPNQTLLSGPAAGVVFASQLGISLGEKNVVSFDIGGTSTDIAVMPDGRYRESRQGRISGQDIGTPMIQIHTLGAGGGTIAWIGPDGLLKAGPHSAGALPGPACYARGGTLATVTDANMVLGYLDAAGLVGGKLKLDPALAERAIREHVATPLGLGLEEAALGIIRIVNVHMEVDLRLTLGERGLDPRRFALVAFGGAGPLHAAAVAANVGIPRVIVPPNPGIGCAIGLLQTEVRHYYLKSRLAPLGSLTGAEIEGLFAGLEEQAIADAKAEGFGPKDVKLQRQLDLRYPFQGYELNVACPEGRFDEAAGETVRRAFDALHQEVYGVSAPQEMPDLVNLRLVSVCAVPRLDLPEWPVGDSSPEAARAGSRKALFEGAKAAIETPVYRRERLKVGNRIEGPAIIEQLDSTTVIPPGQRAEVKRYGALVIETGKG